MNRLGSVAAIGGLVLAVGCGSGAEMSVRSQDQHGSAPNHDEVLRKLRGVVAKNEGDRYSVVQSFKPEWRHVYCTVYLEIDVNNGGFDQYFYNPSGEFAYDAAEGFAAMGAHEVADVVRRAIQVFKDGYPEQKLFEHKGHWRPVTHKRIPELEELDKQFYDLTRSKSPRSYREAYILRNAQAFSQIQ